MTRKSDAQAVEPEIAQKTDNADDSLTSTVSSFTYDQHFELLLLRVKNSVWCCCVWLYDRSKMILLIIIPFTLHSSDTSLENGHYANFLYHLSYGETLHPI